MNSDFEMQTESYTPWKINLVNNLIEALMWEQCTALTECAFPDASPMEAAVLLRFAIG